VRGHCTLLKTQEAAVKLSTKAFAWTGAICWGLSVFIVAVLNQMWPKYGVGFLDVARSLYPGYAAMSGFGAVIVGTLYAAVDGAVCFGVFAWVYNKFAGTPAA
jgi:hypothetical protein